MKILVTGSTGFIGTYIVDQLVKDGADVIAIGRSNEGELFYKKMGIRFVRVDLTKEEDFNKLPKDIEGVIHCAGLLSIDMYKPQDYLMTNTLGTFNLLEYCRKTDVKKIVFAMTHSNVNRATDIIITEETPEQFSGQTIPYIISKISAMKLIETYNRDYGIQGVSLRLPGVRGYGSRFISFWEGKPEISVFQMFVLKAMKGEPIEIWGEHKTFRDLVYVKDVVSGFIKALNSKNATGLYNIGSGIGLTIEQEARAIIKVFSPPNNPSKIVYRPDIEEMRRKSFIFSIEKAKKDFGYVPKYSYEDAMKDYKQEMFSGRFKHLVSKQEAVLMQRFNMSVDELLHHREPINIGRI
jgi:UDP-glucose 4-epimerase